MTLQENLFGHHAILLAAGNGSRFDPLGNHDKLLQPLGNGCSVAVTSATNLLAIMPRVLAVVRPGNRALQAELAAIGCEVTVCGEASDGMGASLAHAIARTATAAGWIVALADMPYVKPSTIRALLDTLKSGTDIVAPSHNGCRGNPVGFSSRYLPHLVALSGDEGARRLLQTAPVQLVQVDDPGILRDIDLPQDLLH